MEDDFMTGLVFFLIIFLLILFALVIFILFAPITATIESLPNRSRSFFIITLRISKIPVYRMAFGIYFKYAAIPSAFLITSRGFRRLQLSFQKKKKPLSPFVRRLVRAALHTLDFPKISFTLSFGLGDAKLTSQACGWIQTVYSITVCIFKKKIKTDALHLIPQFDKEAFSLECFCIIKIKVADIIKESIKQKGGGLYYASNRKYFTDNHVGN